MKFLSTPSARRATQGIRGSCVNFIISIHALREEGDRCRRPFLRLSRPFLSTPSARRATFFRLLLDFLRGISIHALREEGDPNSLQNQLLTKYFYPRPPRGGRHRLRRAGRHCRDISIHALREEGDTGSGALAAIAAIFLSTPSARRATHRSTPWIKDMIKFLSTPSARRATGFIRFFAQRIPISIHALREEGDTATPIPSATVWEFLSTPSARRATSTITAMRTAVKFLSTPSARRATAEQQKELESLEISIHALREEGDVVGSVQLVTKVIFLSTPSARRATPVSLICPVMLKRFLSTPSARRATVTRAIKEQWPTYFYPRPPRGGRPACAAVHLLLDKFLSTPSARRATPDRRDQEDFRQISIHALREEGDVEKYVMAYGTTISIHALREEGDSKNRDKISIFKQIIQHSARI